MQNIVHGITLFTLCLPSHPGRAGDTVCDLNSYCHGETLSSHFGLYEGTEDGLIFLSPLQPSLVITQLILFTLKN